MEQKKRKRRVEKTEGHAKAWLSFWKKNYKGLTMHGKQCIIISNKGNRKTKKQEEKDMKKYELKMNSVEVKKEDVREGCAVDDMNAQPTLIKSFESKEEAMEELKKYNTEIDEFSTATGTLCNVTEYYVEENEYDEDGEWISGGDVWEISKMMPEK